VEHVAVPREVIDQHRIIGGEMRELLRESLRRDEGPVGSVL
jgi:hypothetical protein